MTYSWDSFSRAYFLVLYAIQRASNQSINQSGWLGGEGGGSAAHTAAFFSKRKSARTFENFSGLLEH